MVSGSKVSIKLPVW